MWGSLIPVVGTLLDKLIPDPQAAAEAKLKAVELAQRGELAHLDAEDGWKPTYIYTPSMCYDWPKRVIDKSVF